MSKGLTKEQVDDLLDNVIGVTKRMGWKGTKQQFTCPVHGESHPSAGINIDFVPPDSSAHLQVFNCFSCGESGSLAWLVYRSLPDEFRSLSDAEKFLNERYGVEISSFSKYDSSTLDLKRYEDFFVNIDREGRFEMPRNKLAVFKSGKETYKYFFDRGFTKEDMKTYMIGRDLENETVTIPAFWEDGKLAGVIGRYIDPKRPKNMRFKIYGFPKGSLIYPLDKLEVIDDTIIGVESMLDVIMLRNWGYFNAVAIMGDGMSVQQAGQIVSRCHKFIDLFDNDKGGMTARSIAKKRLGSSILYLTPTYYPDFGKDPSEWGKEETEKVINSASIGKKLPRL